MNTTPLEINEQIAFVEYLGYLKDMGKIKIFTALPNNTYTRSWSQKRKMKEEGLKPGFPDLCIVTNKEVVFVEMKRAKGGTLSPAQKEWIEALTSVGVKAIVAKGFDKAKEFIEENI